MPGGINLYAEFLFNISQVTIHASLDVQGKTDKLAHLHSDRQRIWVQYAGEKAGITYPTGITGKATAHVPLEAASSLSLRLEILEKGDPAWKALEVTNESPWTASSFTKQTRIACRSCETPLLQEDGHTIQWKDLPRDGWAEMMDFWHCHKPPESSNDGVSAKKGLFDTASRPSVKKGTAFIDVCDIIIDIDDCHNVSISEGQEISIIQCAMCKARLGTFDYNLRGYRLNKWSVSVRLRNSLTWEHNEIASLISVQLLSLIEAQGVRKIIVRSEREEHCDPEDELLLWILNPDLKYCASYIAQGSPRRAMKVLYQDHATARSETLQGIDKDAEIALPNDIFVSLRTILSGSTCLLPERAQKLQDWNVGLLDRFDDIRTNSETSTELI